HRQGIAIELQGLPQRYTPAILPEEQRDPWFESLSESSDARMVLHFCMPHQVEAESGRININHTMFEATRIPAAWVAAGANLDRVLLPTESSRQAWIQSGF